MIHHHIFPENSIDAPEFVQKQLKNIPGKSYTEQDTIINTLLWHGYFIVKGMDENVIASMATIDQPPYPREALSLWKKQDPENESIRWNIYVHKKTGKYYKFPHTP